MNLEYATTEEAVAIYNATHAIFVGLIKEVRVLSSKKPDVTLSKGKVKIINRMLADLLKVLEREPEYKFLDLLDDDDLPQTSDAVLVMVQYESTLGAFKERYLRQVKNELNYHIRDVWVTDKLTLEKNEVFDE